jgi:hypothetical protein
MTSIKEQLDKMLKRSISLCSLCSESNPNGTDNGRTPDVVTDAATKHFITTLASEIDKPDKAKAMAEMIVAAWDDKTGKLQRSLNAVRMEQIGNFIVSESTFQSSFFNVITLAPDEQPGYINDTLHEVKVGYIGEDGHPQKVRIVKPQERTLVGLYSIASDEVRYRTEDIYRGDVRQTALATINIARDIRIKSDRLHYTALTASLANGGCYGAFSYEASNTKVATRIYNAHSVINTSLLPTTNQMVQKASTSAARWDVQWYDPATLTNGDGFRPAVLMLIEDYSNAWGDCLPFGQTGTRLVPTGEIIMPSDAPINLARYLTPVSNTLENVLQEQVLREGYMKLALNGRTWTFIPDVTIPSGTLYPRFNLMAGLSYVKPSWDRAFVKQDIEQNWEERWNRKAFGIVIPSQSRPRSIQITYNT